MLWLLGGFACRSARLRLHVRKISSNKRSLPDRLRLRISTWFFLRLPPSSSPMPKTQATTFLHPPPPSSSWDMDSTIASLPAVPLCSPHGNDCAHCHGYGNMACKNCLLVVYCSAKCQAAHWKGHKKYCKSPMLKDGWQPRWITQNRKPTFINADGGTGARPSRHFWGNVPALDVIQLVSNEGLDYNRSLKLLFAGTFARHCAFIYTR